MPTAPAQSRRHRLLKLFAGDERGPDAMARMVDLVDLFLELPPPPGTFPRYAELREDLAGACADGDGDDVEEALLELYVYVHGHEAPYTKDERALVDEAGGYWAHAGGLSPILMAGPYLPPGAVSCDLGAGNGLQGLLFQKFYPHARTVLVEISSEAVAHGRLLQKWLGIDEARVEWVIGDVRDFSIEEIDFLYLYRPLRNVGPGAKFYRKLAADLERSPRGVVVFSIADCLREFVTDAIEVFFTDGHLTCLRKA